MAHFAEIDANNVVLRVIVISNEECNNLNFPESESIGANFCRNLFGGNWRQTSYNANFRKNYAGIGFTYDELLDAFIPPSPYPSWVFNENLCQWEAPVPYPNDGKKYYWDETEKKWIEMG